MRRLALTGFLALGSLAGFLAVAKGAQPFQAPAVETPADLRLAMRDLWSDHITYTRAYIVSALAGLPDEDAVAARLMRNQGEIGASIVPYFGREAGDQLAALLREHISIATEVVARAQASDAGGLKRAQAKWAANGALLAAFLGETNPYWDKTAVAGMLTEHLATTTAEIRARMAQDWGGDIRNYDLLHAHMMRFADLLSDGIRRRFPEKFSPAKP